MQDLFGYAGQPAGGTLRLAEDAVVLRGLARDREAALLDAIAAIAGAAPFRHMITPGGREMSVAMTNCGAAGWVSDRTGYRYARQDPETGLDWPAMPDAFTCLAGEAAGAAGFDGFVPDACLINRYRPGARLTLHQDRDEADFGQPIVSVSLGLPAIFLFGGATRRDRSARIALESGDVAVWGGRSRLAHHGIAPLAEGEHPLAGAVRYNLTFRKAL